MAMLGQFTASTLPPLRLYAAKAAATLNDRATLRALSADADRGGRKKRAGSLHDRQATTPALANGRPKLRR